MVRSEASVRADCFHSEHTLHLGSVSRNWLVSSAAEAEVVGEAHVAVAGEGEPGILQRKAMQIWILTSTEPLVLELWVDF